MNQTEAIELLRNAIEALLDDIEDHRGTGYGEFDTEEQARKAFAVTASIEAPTLNEVERPEGSTREPTKDHILRDVVNNLRDIAVQYHDTQQLRERLRSALEPLLEGK